MILHHSRDRKPLRHRLAVSFQRLPSWTEFLETPRRRFVAFPKAETQEDFYNSRENPVHATRIRRVISRARLAPFPELDGSIWHLTLPARPESRRWTQVCRTMAHTREACRCFIHTENYEPQVSEYAPPRRNRTSNTCARPYRAS